jgi:type I restriction enzyme S subunit
VIEVGDVVDILSGYPFESALFNNERNGLPLVRIRDVGKKESATFYPGTYKKDYLINTGDYLIGMDGDFRLAVWEGGEALLNQRVCKITAKKEKIHPKYLFYALPKELKKIEDSTSFATVKHLSVKSIKAIKIPLPPLAEQQKIAAILDAADSLRQKDRQLVEKYTALSQSLFLEMFGDPVTNPMGWEIRAIEKILDRKSQNGLYLTQDKYKSTGIEMVHMSDAFYGIVSPGNLKRVTLTDQELERYKLSANDLLLARRSLTYEGAAKPCLIPEYSKNLVYESSLIRITPKKELANSFYLYFFFSNKGARNKFINKYISRSTISGINNKGLNSINIPLPPITLQNQFAERIQLIEQQKQQAQASLEKSEALFNSLLQRAFTGELTKHLAA